MEHLLLEDQEKCKQYISSFVKETQQREAEAPAKTQRIWKYYKEAPTPQTPK